MEKENEIKTMVPTLRFPEFREQIGWEVEPLSNILDYERPDNFIVETETYCEEGIPVLTANKSFILGYTRESTGIYVNLPVIIFDDFTTDKKYVNFPFKVKSSAIKILHTKRHTDILRFIYELMSQITFEAKEHKRYYISTYQRIQVPLPKENEQYKIAECLSSLDRLIEATTQKVDALKEHKKGLMQRLFPAEGKNVPDLRFPEFQGMNGWEKTYIYEECPNPYSGGTPKTTEKKYYGGNIPFIRSAEIGKDKTELSITQEGLNNSSAKMIQKGDLLIALYGANSGDIAISKIDGAINQAILCLKAKSNNLFIYYTLLKKQKYIVSKYLQGGQGNLSGEIIKSIDFYIPQEIEQQKIADCLSSLDELIEATSRKVEILKEHKKGLMQQLFPKI